MKTFKIETGDAIVDIWSANSEEEALDLFAKDAGYKNYEALVAEHGEVDSIEEVEINDDI